MPSAPQQPSSQGGDNSLAPFWIICGIFALAWGTWYFAHEQIAMLVLKIRLFEAELIGWFTDGSTKDLIALIKNTAPGDADVNMLSTISVAVGKYLSYPAIAILVVFALIIYLGKASARYKKTYNMQRLKQEEKTIWPQITPVTNLDLVNTDIDKGPWAMALSPMQFAKKYKLLQEERVLITDTASTLQHARTVVSLRREEAHQIFSLQLGRYWPGIEGLNKHTKALFAAFAARVGRDQEGSRKLLLQIAASTAHGKLDFSGTDELLEKHKNNKAVIKITQQHAFLLTVMAGLLRLAREDGVLATADFLWLKPIDRSLWFMLNSVGRQTPFTEVAGPVAHWLAERRFDRKLSVPMVEEAVNALDQALKEIIYIPDEDVEGSVI
jgi:intracellular multiplication protein IcmP